MSIDINVVRSVITLLWFALFIAIAVTAWSKRRRDEYSAAARIPLEASDAIDGEVK